MRLYVVALAAAALAAVPSAAQSGVRVGNFHLERKADLITDRDESFASVSSQGDGALFVMWHCFGEGLLIGLNFEGYRTDPGLAVVWRFDQDRPDTAFLERSETSTRVFILPRVYNHRFTTRARTAGRLVVRTMERSGTTDHVVQLNGSERALGALACVRNLRPPEDPPGLLGTTADQARRLPPPVELRTRADTIGLIERHYTQEMARARLRGEVAVRLQVDAQGNLRPESVEVMRTASEQLNAPAMDIAARLLYESGPRERWMMVYIYFDPNGRHTIQTEKMRP